LNERQAIAVLLASLRKSKKFSNPTLFAESAGYLVRRYGSPEAVAERLSVGKETIRALAKVAEMPSEIKNLIATRRLLLTVAFDLIPLSPTHQVRLAREVAGLPFKDARAIIRYSSRNPGLAMSRVKKVVLRDLEKQEVNIAVVRLPRKIHDRMMGEGPDVMVSGLCDRWFADGTPVLPVPNFSNGALRTVIKVPRKAYGRLRARTNNIANLIERLAYYYLS
jgi:hypothetical protein